MAGLNSFAVDAAAPKVLHERGTALEIRCEKYRELTDEIARLRNEMATLPASELLGGGHSAEIQRREIEAIEIEMALRKDLLKHADDVGKAHRDLELQASADAGKIQQEMRSKLLELGYRDQTGTAGVNMIAASHPRVLTLRYRAAHGLAREGGDIHRGYSDGQRRAIAELEKRLEAIRQNLLSDPPTAAPVAEPPTVTGFQRREFQVANKLPDGAYPDGSMTRATTGIRV